MSLQLPNARITLSEPKPFNRKANDDAYHDSNSFQVQKDRAWLRDQLLVGKNSPLCDPISPTHFDELRARVRRTFARARGEF